MKSFLISLVAALTLSGVHPLLATEPLRLDEIPVVRFLEVSPNQWTAQHGLLSSAGDFREVERIPVLSTVSIPAEALNRNLISIEAWLAYIRLGPEAVVNFSADAAGDQYKLGERYYLDIAPVANPTLTNGRLLALATRAYVPADEPMIAGFVIRDRPRRVLVRAVGPSLGALGVGNPLADPTLTLYRGSTEVDRNDAWSDRSDADEIAQVAAQLGLTPFASASPEAALLVDLPPGNYTAHIRPQTGGPGVALFEVYTVTE